MRLLGEPAMDVRGEAASHAMASAQLFESLFVGRPKLFERARSIAQSLDYGPYFALMTPRPGMYEVLATIRERYRVAMATNRGKTASEVVRRFSLDPYIELTVGVLDAARLKPHPDMLERCVSHFGLTPGDALYVGDQQIDADAASAAGLTFVAVGETVRSADYRITELHELLPLLRRL